MVEFGTIILPNRALSITAVFCILANVVIVETKPVNMRDKCRAEYLNLTLAHVLAFYHWKVQHIRGGINEVNLVDEKRLQQIQAHAIASLVDAH